MTASCWTTSASLRRRLRISSHRKKEGDKFVPPAVRFLWGSFQFDGLMDSLEESLEFFSNDGRPLRASMSLTLSQQKIQAFKIRNESKAPATSSGQRGTGSGRACGHEAAHAGARRL